MIDFTVVVDDGDRYTVKATARDILQWEKSGNGRNFTALMSTLPLADLYRIAYLASVRKGLFDGKSGDFEKTCDLVFEVDAEPDPTPVAR